MEKEIHAVLIFEMLGRPADYLKTSLVEFVEKIEKVEGVKVVKKEIHEPKRFEKSKEEIYTTFAEVEMKFKNLDSMFGVVFVFMPSHIDVISPQELQLKNFEISTLVNELARKLHQYDEIAKRLTLEILALKKRMGENKKPEDKSVENTEKNTQEKTY